MGSIQSGQPKVKPWNQFMHHKLWTAKIPVLRLLSATAELSGVPD